MKIEQLKKLQGIWERRQILVDMISEMKSRMQSAFESECDFDLEIKDKVEGSNSCSSDGGSVAFMGDLFKRGSLSERLAEISDSMRYQPGCSGTPVKSKTNHKTIMKGLTNMQGMMVFQLLIDMKAQELKEVEKDLIEKYLIEKDLIANGLDLKP